MQAVNFIDCIPDFESTYHKHVDIHDKIFLRFVQTAADGNLMDIYVLMNDEYQIPPADLFTRMNKDIVTKTMKDDRNVKQYIGAYFGYLFKFIYKNFTSVSKRISDRYILSSASYYVHSK